MPVIRTENSIQHWHQGRLMLELPLQEKFNPNEPRDETGEWTSGGAHGKAAETIAGGARAAPKPVNGSAAGRGSSGDVRKTPSIITIRPEITKRGDTRLVPPALRPHLNEPQQQGVALAIDAMEKHGGALNSDGTGLGKSRQQLAVARHFADKGFAAIIVSPVEVIKPDWEAGKASGSFPSDADKMGMQLKLIDGEASPEKGQVSITTYDELALLKNKIDKKTVLILDESHVLRNPDSARAKHAMEAMDRAHSVMYATATPGDKPLHLSHLVRANVFGNIGASATYKKLGLVRVSYKDANGKTKRGLVVDPSMGYAESARRISGLFDRMTKDGLMVRRELSLDNVSVDLDRIELTDEQHAKLKEVYDSKMQLGPLARGLALLTTRLHQEPYKIPHTVGVTKKELDEGRSVIVFVGRVNDMEDSQGTAKGLKEQLLKAGLSESELGALHGGVNPKERRQAIADFQAGKVRVLISTLQSGATGINLDDTVGDRPRTVILMTPPFTAAETLQAMGRVNRLNTKSDVRVRGILANTDIDDWNAGILESKFRTLGAAVRGSSSQGSAVIGKDTEGDWHKDFDWGESLLPKQGFESVAVSKRGPVKAKKQAGKKSRKKRSLAARLLWKLFEAYDPEEARDDKGKWVKGRRRSSKHLQSFLDGNPKSVKHSFDVEAVKYDKEKQLLRVAFKSRPGRWYKYSGVDADLATKLFQAKNKDAFLTRNVLPEPEPNSKAYYCRSKIGGTYPKIGPVYHASVAICPPGELPVVDEGGTPVSNPKCLFFGTQTGYRTFQLEGRRVDVDYKELPATDAKAVWDNIKEYNNRPWKLLTNNCQTAAKEVLKSVGEVLEAFDPSEKRDPKTGQWVKAGKPPAGLKSFLDGKPKKLKSSFISAAKYTREDQTLRLAFHGQPGVWHKYEGVSEQEAEAFARSDSKGVFYHDNIKGRELGKGEYLKAYGGKDQPDFISPPFDKPAELYHGSSVADLETLETRSSRVLGGGKAVFGTPDRDLAISFVAPWTDDDFEQGYVNGQPYMREQYPGAFEKVYAGKSGNVYSTTSRGFVTDPRLMRVERIKHGPAAVKGVIRIPDALEALKKTRIKLIPHGQPLPE